MSLASLDDEENSYYKENWNSDVRHYVIEHHNNDDLDLIYEMLGELGYEMSDEELQMQDGTHPLFLVDIDAENDMNTEENDGEDD